MAYKRTGKYSRLADELDLIINYYEHDGIICDWSLETFKQPILIKIVGLLFLAGCILMWIFVDEVPYVKLPLFLFKIFITIVAIDVFARIDTKYGGFWHAFGASGSDEWQEKRLYEKYDIFVKKKDNLVKYLRSIGADLTDIRDRMKKRNPKSRSPEEDHKFVFTIMTLIITLICLFGNEYVQTIFSSEYNVILEIGMAIYIMYFASTLLEDLFTPESYMNEHSLVIDEIVMILDSAIADEKREKGCEDRKR